MSIQMHSNFKVSNYTMDEAEKQFYQNLTSGSSAQIDRISKEKIQIAPYPFAKEEKDFYQKLSIGSTDHKLSFNDLPEEVIQENILPYLQVNDVYNFSVLSKNFYQSANQFCYRKSVEEGYHLSDLEQSDTHHSYIQVYKKEKFAEMIDSTGRTPGRELTEEIVKKLLVVTFKIHSLHYWSFSERATVYSLKLRYAKQLQLEDGPDSLVAIYYGKRSENKTLLSDLLTDQEKKGSVSKRIHVVSNSFKKAD